jgi:hypothetical protein
MDYKSAITALEEQRLIVAILKGRLDDLKTKYHAEKARADAAEEGERILNRAISRIAQYAYQKSKKKIPNGGVLV